MFVENSVFVRVMYRKINVRIMKIIDFYSETICKFGLKKTEIIEVLCSRRKTIEIVYSYICTYILNLTPILFIYVQSIQTDYCKVEQN